MALHKDFPTDPHAILAPAIRWFLPMSRCATPATNKLSPTRVV